MIMNLLLACMKSKNKIGTIVEEYFWIKKTNGLGYELCQNIKKTSWIAYGNLIQCNFGSGKLS